MPDIIQLLPDSIANQIAAGEVIQRPASAVKELLENALDAGASEITLVIKEAGKQLIQVTDNGCGMSDTDARMSFERHATSKIHKAEDLFAIRTMGFRGEALASIAAISQVELKSRPHDQEIGTHIRIEASEVKSQEPSQTPPGTTFIIKNLFYNIPARRNFLKSNTVETRHIIDEFQRVALANPEVAFKMQHNSIEVFNLPPSNLRKRITAIFGRSYNERLVPVEESTPVVSIKGFIGKPDFVKKTRGEQYFFVNNRFIKSPYLNHAILGAYEDLIPSNTYPLYVLFFDLDPERIDVNVHPTKQEVKFEDEKILYAYLNSAVKRALGKYSITPTLDFEGEPGLPINPSPGQTQQHQSSGFPSMPRKEQRSGNQGWEQYLETATKQRPSTITIPSDWTEASTEKHEEKLDTEPDIKPFQLHQQFIIAPIKDGLIVIDQQAAHERVLYTRYVKALENRKAPMQKTLFPQSINLNRSDAELLRSLLSEVNALGFDIQEFGKDDFVVHGLPADLEGQGEQDLIEGMLEQYKQHESELNIPKRDNLARSLAGQTAIKKGQSLTEREMTRLIDELFACPDFYIAPNGNLTFVKYALHDLERQFEKKR